MASASGLDRIVRFSFRNVRYELFCKGAVKTFSGSKETSPCAKRHLADRVFAALRQSFQAIDHRQAPLISSIAQTVRRSFHPCKKCVLLGRTARSLGVGGRIKKGTVFKQVITDVVERLVAPWTQSFRSLVIQLHIHDSENGNQWKGKFEFKGVIIRQAVSLTTQFSYRKRSQTPFQIVAERFPGAYVYYLRSHLVKICLLYTSRCV